MLQKILRLLRVSDVLFVDNAKRTRKKKWCYIYILLIIYDSHFHSLNNFGGKMLLFLIENLYIIEIQSCLTDKVVYYF